MYSSALPKQIGYFNLTFHESPRGPYLGQTYQFERKLMWQTYKIFNFSTNAQFKKYKISLQKRTNTLTARTRLKTPCKAVAGYKS